MEHVLRKPLTNREVAFSVLRVPFFLEPDYDESKTYIERNRDRLVKKWGGREGWERQKKRHDLKGRGLEAGIPKFNLDRLAASSMASHRLIQMLGKTHGLDVSEAVYDLLNVYYFVEGKSLNDKPQLAKVVSQKLKEMGIETTTDDLLTFLNGNQGRSEIEHAIASLRHLGVSGIPKFIIEGRVVIDGAANSDTFIKVFREIERRGRVLGSPVFGEVLGVSPDVIARGSHWAEDLVA
jgi:predicted DsbA family dithiol-disulfide isomerase